MRTRNQYKHAPAETPTNVGAIYRSFVYDRGLWGWKESPPYRPHSDQMREVILPIVQSHLLRDKRRELVASEESAFTPKSWVSQM